MSIQIDDGHTVDQLYHSWIPSHAINFRVVGVYRNMRNNENNTRLNFSEWKLLQPNHIQIEDQDAFDRTMNYSQYMTHGDPWKNGYHSFKNHLRALNSLRR